MQIKEIVFKLSFLYNLLSVSFLMKITGKKYIHVFYHFIVDKENDLVNQLYKAKNKEEFIKDLSFLKKNFVNLKGNDIHSNAIENGFLLSFDDGLTNFYTVVAPILIKQNISAINFLNSGFINNKSLFYRYKVNLLLNQIEDKEIDKQQEKLLVELLDLKNEFKNSLIEYLKKETIKDVLMIDEVSVILKFSFEDVLNNEPYLNNNQIIELQSKGFDFGAHSKTHPRFSEISFDDQVKETLESLKEVKDEFDIKNNFFSFPFSDDGVTKSFFSNMAQEKIITFGSSGLKDEANENHFQRIQMEYTSAIYSAETIVKGELIYYLIKKVFNKHKTLRKL